MSTRANIKFQDGDEYIHVDRSHDGYPEQVLPDIKEVIDLCRGRWSGAELGQLVSAFLGFHFDKNRRIQDYEPCIGFETTSDTNYHYYVRWNESTKEFDFGVLTNI
jgi:hypothetical protein